MAVNPPIKNLAGFVGLSSHSDCGQQTARRKLEDTRLFCSFWR